MRLICVSVLVLLVAAAYAIPAPAAQKGATYTTKFDNVNIDQILTNKRLLDNYMKCLLDKGPCTTEGAELRKHVPDALETSCSKCSDKQRAGVEKVMKHLYEKRRKDFEELEKKYDPQQKHRQRLREEARKRGIKV